MSLQDRKAAVYQQDVRGIGERYLDGKDDLVATNLRKWPPLHNKTVEEMWADAVAYLLKKVLPGLRSALRGMERQKRWGKETYYKYGWGEIPIDEAIKRQEALIVRCEGTVIKAPVGEE
ncbi:hypothetical protein ES708_10549 [subsurface metagenome]